MAITTLDELIERLQQSRDAAGSNLPVRLKLAIEHEGDDRSPSTHVVSTRGLLVMRCVGEDGKFIQLAAPGATQN